MTVVAEMPQWDVKLVFLEVMILKREGVSIDVRNF